jgi:hypothetical protein
MSLILEGYKENHDAHKILCCRHCDLEIHLRQYETEQNLHDSPLLVLRASDNTQDIFKSISDLFEEIQPGIKR